MVATTWLELLLERPAGRLADCPQHRPIRSRRVANPTVCLVGLRYFSDLAVLLCSPVMGKPPGGLVGRGAGIDHATVFSARSGDDHRHLSVRVLDLGLVGRVASVVPRPDQRLVRVRCGGRHRRSGQAKYRLAAFFCRAGPVVGAGLAP